MGGGQPYLYGPPQRFNQLDPYNGFNPKAVSYATPPPPRPKQNGPLVNFNTHPDGFAVTPTGSTCKPMHPKTGKRVRRVRRTQLAFRCLQLIGAVGLLVAVICIKNTKNTEGYIIRAPPAVDLLISLYAIYHLVRRKKDQVPTSSATYHMFAFAMDAGLIPFYIFIGMLGHAQYQMRPNTAGRWLSQFDSDNATAQLIYAVWCIAAVNGGLHAISLFMDVYLIIMFRKIANLPPDMNPLEEEKKDNLTRRKTKHKYKNSEVSLIGNEKHFSNLSGSTFGSADRSSKIYEDDKDTRMSFMTSRNGANPTYSPHNPKTVETLRNSMYQQGNNRTSRVHVGSHQRSHSFVNAYPEASRMSPMPSSLPMSPKRNQAGSVVSSLHSYDTSSSASSVSAIEDKDDKFFAIGDETDEYHYVKVASDPLHAPKPRRSHLQEITNMALNVNQHNQQHQPHLARGISSTNPLRMNPPTPPPQPIAARKATAPLSPHLSRTEAPSMPFSSSDSDMDRSRTMLSNITSSSAYSQESQSANSGFGFGVGGLKSIGAPKSKFYGDLASAMRGVRQLVPSQEKPDTRPKSMVGSVHYVGDESRNSRWGAGVLNSVVGTVVRKNSRDEDDLVNEDRYGRLTNGGYGRVVSRSGVDSMDVAGDLGMGRRRDVSGKIAEEGRGGPAAGSWFASGLLRRTSRKY